ncbi:hypothetical protein D3C85_1579880 [compost metagenome]
MENELVEKESWLKRNWKWSVPTTILIIFTLGLFLTSNSSEDISDIVGHITTIYFMKRLSRGPIQTKE